MDNLLILLVLRWLGLNGSLLIFHRLVMADRTAGGSPQHGMMTSNMAGHSANGGTGATAGLGGGDRSEQTYRQRGGDDQGFHPRGSQGC